MADHSPVEKIYITYKTRMNTEARLRRQAAVSYIMLTWYSIALTILSLIDLSKIFTISNFSIISASFSIVTLAASMFIYGARYSERADQFRSCYLKLQALYESQLPVATKMRKYAEILELYENQSDNDYDDMLFDAYMRGQTLSNANGAITVSWYTVSVVTIRRIIRLALLSVLFLIPVIFCVLWVRPI